jgi:hypothetical protein
MAVRVVLVALVLGACGGPDAFEAPDAAAPLTCEEPRPGCSDDLACDNGQCQNNPLYACDTLTGEWEWERGCGGVVSLKGDLYLDQSVGGLNNDPALQPRRPVGFFVDPDYTVTAAPPIEVLSAEVNGGIGTGIFRATVEDVWGELPVTITYDLVAYDSGDIQGTAELTYDGGWAVLQVNGSVCPAGVQLCAIDADAGAVA